MSSFVQRCSDANSELTADARLPLDHGAASSEWSCSASLFNGGALVKRGVTKCYKEYKDSIFSISRFEASDSFRVVFV